MALVALAEVEIWQQRGAVSTPARHFANASLVGSGIRTKTFDASGQVFEELCA